MTAKDRHRGSAEEEVVAVLATSSVVQTSHLGAEDVRGNKPHLPLGFGIRTLSSNSSPCGLQLAQPRSVSKISYSEFEG